MKYRWIEKDLTGETCISLGQKLGCTVKSISSGNVIVGYIDTVDDEGKPEKIPVVKKGFEIELDGETPDILKQLDATFLGYIREGGGNLREELDQLIARVDALESG